MAGTVDTDAKNSSGTRSGKDNARWVIGLLIFSVGVFATLSVLS